MGEVFAGRYELVDLLGQGGMGSVWRAWDRRGQRYVGAKVLGQSDAASLLRFVREQALRIHHPHVLAPLGWAAEDDRVLFTMDIVTGGSVATLIGDHGPLPATYAACLLDQLLSGLSAVHAAGVVHRDVKPANLLLQATARRRPVLRLSDFGIAVHMDEPRLTATGLIIGTRGYVPAEQLQGADPHPTQDLYAVGVVGAHLLTGVAPDPSGSIPVQPPAGVPPELWTLLRDLSAPKAADRPQTAMAAGRRLAATGLVPGASESLPWLAEVDPVEVFPQLPALPPGWGPNGPVGTVGAPPAQRARASSSPPAPARRASAAVAPVAATRVDSRSTARNRTAPGDAPADTTAGIGPVAPDRGAVGSPDGSDRHNREVDPGNNTHGDRSDDPAPVGQPASEARSRRRLVVPLVAAAAATVGAIFLVPQLVDRDRGEPTNSPNTKPTAPGTASSPAPSPTSSGPGDPTSSPSWTFPVKDLTPGAN